MGELVKRLDKIRIGTIKLNVNIPKYGDATKGVGGGRRKQAQMRVQHGGWRPTKEREGGRNHIRTYIWYKDLKRVQEMVEYG